MAVGNARRRRGSGNCWLPRRQLGEQSQTPQPPAVHSGLHEGFAGIVLITVDSLPVERCSI